MKKYNYWCNGYLLVHMFQKRIAKRLKQNKDYIGSHTQNHQTTVGSDLPGRAGGTAATKVGKVCVFLKKENGREMQPC